MPRPLLQKIVAIAMGVVILSIIESPRVLNDLTVHEQLKPAYENLGSLTVKYGSCKTKAPM